MTRLSRYFAGLSSSYQAELDDLRTDSEGNNVLRARLGKKREQLSQLLVMMQFAPEMVAVAFHGGFSFKHVAAMESLIAREPNKFPSWATLCKAITIEPWAQALIPTVLSDPNGETFLVTTAGLEYLNRRPAQPSVVNRDESEDDESESEDQDEGSFDPDERFGDEDEESEQDLDQAGADWLAQQGFDRKE